MNNLVFFACLVQLLSCIPMGHDRLVVDRNTRGIEQVDHGSHQVRKMRIRRLPKFVDWRSKGIVSEVQNQLDCGAGWAFAAAGAIEGQHALKYGPLTPLSAQNLVDCSKSYGNHGCHGGVLDASYNYSVNGIDTLVSYPFTGRDENCHFNHNTVGANVSSYVNLPPGNERELKRAVANIGPIASGIHAGIEFRDYTSGVLYVANCSTTDINHNMLIVGYGVENKTDYWLLKNSYGLNWGYSGYVLLARNKRNMCGIATAASYPVL